jgi:exodeoxyribonuclease VII small subunit
LAETSNDDVKAMSFEAALAELEGIVQKLESGKAPLAESIAIYERGEALKSHCETLLKAAEARIEKITLKNGQPTGTEPLDA